MKGEVCFLLFIFMHFNKFNVIVQAVALEKVHMVNFKEGGASFQ